MRYRLDRIDFSEATHCALCARSPRPLRTGMAYIVVDEDGKEHAAGPYCAVQKTINGKTKPPDFTRGSLDDPEEVAELGETVIYQGGRAAPTNQSDHDKAIEYIRLRAEKLSHISQIQHSIITRHYKQWLNSPDYRLDVDIIRSILTISHNAPNVHAYLEMQRLQTVYAFDYWLSKAIDKVQKTFIIAKRDTLRRNLRLSPKQIEVVNTIFAEELPRMGMRLPRLNPGAFA